MQIIHAEVIPVELKLSSPVRMAKIPPIEQITAFFVHLETRESLNAWGCAVAHPDLTGETPHHALLALQRCVDLAPDLHPTNIELSLARLEPFTRDSLAARCAFDLAFHDLLGLAAGLPLYRLLGGYRNMIQTSATIPLATVEESVELAAARARFGFRLLKIKGGVDPDQDVQRIKAIHRSLPGLILRLDADGGYSLQETIDVVRALHGLIEMLEQPTPADDYESLRQITRSSTIPILADQSVTTPPTALKIAADHSASGICIKVAESGGLLGARQINAVARAADMVTMISCLVEPKLLISAGLSLALSCPNVKYCDLDGYLDLVNDPTQSAGFQLIDGWLHASEVPGLGCNIRL